MITFDAALIRKLAIEAKSCRLTADNGLADMIDSEVPNLTDNEFAALLEAVEAAIPSAPYDGRIAALWAKAGVDVRAESRHERQQLGYAA